MKREIAEAWVADLRTNPPQAYSRLYDGEGYCCLGRLCLVMGASFNESLSDDQFGGSKFCPTLGGTEYDEHEVLPAQVMKLAGMQSKSGIFSTYDDDGEPMLEELTTLNDNGKSLAEIADIIEKHWEKL